MIVYSVPKDYRRQVHFFIALGAIGITMLLRCALNEWVLHATSIQTYDVFLHPSLALFLYGVFMFVFDKYLWHRRPFRNFLGIPNLSGEWRGERIRDGKPGDGYTVTITQRWSSIQIVTHNANTMSYTTSATFTRCDESVKELLFTYDMAPIGGIDYVKNPFGYGTQRLRLSDDGKKLIGPYYSTNTRLGREVLTKMPA